MKFFSNLIVLQRCKWIHKNFLPNELILYKTWYKKAGCESMVDIVLQYQLNTKTYLGYVEFCTIEEFV